MVSVLSLGGLLVLATVGAFVVAAMRRDQRTMTVIAIGAATVLWIGLMSVALAWVVWG